MRRLVVALGLAVCAGSATAEVLDSQAGGFAVRQTLVIAAPAAKVWAALGTPGAWWDPVHSYSHIGKNLTLDMRPGGAWREALPNGGGVTHMMVINFQPRRLLRLEGGLGPLQGFGVLGHLSFDLTEKDGATTLTETYDVGGHAPGGLDQFAAPVDGVLGGQARRLKRYVETGRPD